MRTSISSGLIFILWLFALLPIPDSVRGATGPEPASGMFLVAHPDMRDPRFRESVILLLQHNDTGSLGLVVNRQTPVILQQILPEADRPGFGDKRVFLGGPVSVREALVLIRSDEPPDDSTKIFGKVHLTGIDQLMEHFPVSENIPEFHIYVGHAGWEPGQLQEELDRGEWRVLPADENSVFDPEPERVWERLKGVERLII